MTVFSTWTSEEGGGAPLLGCGVDAERVERFRGDEPPWPALFTPREIAHNRALDDPALGFCASFCAKEALIKAVRVPVDYHDCELLFSPREGAAHLSLDPAFCDEHHIGRSVARVMLSQRSTECVVAICLYCCHNESVQDRSVRE